VIDRRSVLRGASGLGLAASARGATAAQAAPQSGAAQGTTTPAPTLAPTPAPPPAGRAALPARLRRVDLRIRFMTTRDGRTFERGRETVSYDFHEDGLIAYHVSSHSDDPRIARDALYTLGPDWRPREAFVRLQVDGRYEGSGWFRFEPGQVGSETFNAVQGRRSNVTRIDTPVRAFVAHPVSTDVMLAAAYEHGGPKRQRLPGSYTSSSDPYGRVGPTLKASATWLEYAGREALSTPAGTMEADRYELFTGADAQAPLESLWTLPGTSLFLRAQARGIYSTVYELVEFRAA
jgi:hypothetical protein